QWMAHIIQKPDEKPSVAIVMKSVPGTGKGTTVKPLLQILGQYAAHINGAGHISGRFNSILANKLLVFADEVTIHKPSEADRLKAIISEPTFNLERKGIDAEPMPNFARLIFASNSTQV
ncbi:TPA: primase-helicase family protein, partial [Escherichia coli]